MNNYHTILTYRYAQAFLNVQNYDLTETELGDIQHIQKFLYTHKQSIILLQYGFINNTILQKLIEKLNGFCTISLLLHKLINMIITDKRSFLLPSILDAIITLYKKHNKHEVATITSSLLLSQKQQSDIENFFNKATGLIITYKYYIDTTLIAGIRFKSETFMWEHSINQYFYNIKHSLI